MSPFSWVIYPLTQPQVAKQQKNKQRYHYRGWQMKEGSTRVQVLINFGCQPAFKSNTLMLVDPSFCLFLCAFAFFSFFFSVSDRKTCFSIKKLIQTSEQHAEHPFAGQNTQQSTVHIPAGEQLFNRTFSLVLGQNDEPRGFKENNKKFKKKLNFHNNFVKNDFFWCYIEI